MLSKYIALLTVLTAMLMFAACGSFGPSEPSLITYQEHDAGRILEIRLGEVLKIDLEGNPTTGYNWEIESVDATVLQLTKSDFTPDSNAAGAGGSISMYFRPIAAGQTGLRLVYRRAWEEGIPPVKTFEATVVVKE